MPPRKSSNQPAEDAAAVVAAHAAMAHVATTNVAAKDAVINPQKEEKKMLF